MLETTRKTWISLRIDDYNAVNGSVVYELTIKYKRVSFQSTITVRGNTITSIEVADKDVDYMNRFFAEKFEDAKKRLKVFIFTAFRNTYGCISNTHKIPLEYVKNWSLQNYNTL